MHATLSAHVNNKNKIAFLIVPIKRSFLFNNVEVRLVPWHGQDVHPNGNAFYVNNGEGGVIGVRVYPNGRKVLVNPSYAKPAPGLKRPRKEGYMQFRHAWGEGEYILISHAVYSAWVGPIPERMTIDHINGVTTDNRFENLRCVSLEVNMRDGGFLRKLRNKGINPAAIDRAILLRYYSRMAELKPVITSYRYEHLSYQDLRYILYHEYFFVDQFVKRYKTAKNYAKRLEKITPAHESRK